jgi:hypothetical protein
MSEPGLSKNDQTRHAVLVDTFQHDDPDKLADFLGAELETLCHLPPFKNCNEMQREEIALRCISMSAVAQALAWHARKK